MWGAVEAREIRRDGYRRSEFDTILQAFDKDLGTGIHSRSSWTGKEYGKSS